MRASTRTLSTLAHRLTTPSAFIRARGAPAVPPPSLRDDFVLFPTFFSAAESRALAELALWKLDRMDSTRRRRRRTNPSAAGDAAAAGLQDLFAGPYGFEEGHFDSVIHQYRESLVTTLPPVQPATLALLARLYNLVPTLSVPDTPEPADLPPARSSTHVLHLAPEGAILPHVDNLEAMGETIVGAVLGAPRVLRLEVEADGDKHGWDVLVPSGSVYLQKWVTWGSCC
ncbi:hypothetical protein VHUM_04023 [Vanrija humicola]|uniref:Alpha-ketoglutarate-dependent dioxygenase AlkB-like domain-containing protein n=1 Tax=Vanrija humicola TaxID=5417 RepID=A0A7D8YWU1_VANHU|nr:hypothetical protein VHUM_04023 [Vanrija humicola]